MPTYLFTWNPVRWNWDYLKKSIAEIKTTGYCNEPWSCGVTKKITNGDRAFLLKQGVEPRGIVASGWVASSVYEGPHWDKTKRKPALYVDVDWDTILDPSDPIFPRDLLRRGIYSEMHWDAQVSGTRIPDNVAKKLETDWAKFLNRPPMTEEFSLAEEVEKGRTYAEGVVRQVTVNVYERSTEARTMCINHYGLNCFICGFDFEKVYGQVGSGFIHVHHLKPLAEIKQGYKLNPVKDLRPVCPNCHAMLHQRKPAYDIEELKALLKQKK